MKVLQGTEQPVAHCSPLQRRQCNTWQSQHLMQVRVGQGHDHVELCCRGDFPSGQRYAAQPDNIRMSKPCQDGDLSKSASTPARLCEDSIDALDSMLSP
eukprot:CAMPEP_0178397270 /NCGR_PEP_ID=MMETSP0689_2-20121128/14157_1 /TAXON_ID=160604 /ORGANISM="Amphidinium massartii, Strain CS-259" /LENGTH=98 /DNA_ID=CAMNT_0020017969 /DNA_START=744 /DNA_END=1040 /DNA_ORIENTATION=+